MKNIDLDEPTTFLDHENLGEAQREYNSNEIFVERYTEMLKSRTSAGTTEKLTGWERPHAKTVALSYDMEGHSQK